MLEVFTPLTSSTFCSTAHSNDVLTFPNNIYRHTCNVNQSEHLNSYQYKQCKKCKQIKQCGVTSISDGIFYLIISHILAWLTAQEMFVQPIKWLEVFIAASVSNFSSSHVLCRSHFRCFFPLTCASTVFETQLMLRPVYLEIYIFLRIKGREGCTNIYRQNISKPEEEYERNWSLRGLMRSSSYFW